MTEAGRLLLDAKQGIIDEQLRRFLALSREEHWEEAAKQLGVTLACVADLLNEGAQMLDGLQLPEGSRSSRAVRGTWTR